MQTLIGLFKYYKGEVFKIIRGIYTSASGMMSQGIKQETIANNLSNLDTNGYKKDSSIMGSFPDMLINTQNSMSESDGSIPVGRLNLGSLVEENYTEHTQGTLSQTENNLDFALNGNGFFTLQTPEGERYTRDGHFLRDVDGNLVDANGNYVLGEDGEVVSVPTSDIVVDEQGNIAVEDETLNTLTVTEFENPETLIKEGSNFFVEAEETEIDNQEGLNTSIEQGFLEKANIDIQKEMSEAISSLRTYEANQKILQAQDELLGKCVNEVGTLR